MKVGSLLKKVRRQRRRRIIRVRRPLLENRRFRLSVFRSNQHIYAQIIDDKQNKTLVYVSDLKLKGKMTKTEAAEKVGEMLAEKAKEKKIKSVVFDRGWYKFHGRVKALADSSRQHGLSF